MYNRQHSGRSVTGFQDFVAMGDMHNEITFILVLACPKLVYGKYYVCVTVQH